MPYLHAGEIWAVLAAAFWAIAVVLFRQAGEEVPPLSLNLFKDVVALVVFLPLVLLIRPAKAAALGSSDLALLVVSGIVGIGAADTLFFAALNRLGAGLNAVVDCAYAPSVTVFALLFLGDRVGVGAAAGAALVAVAILVGSASRPVAGRTKADIVQGLVLGGCGMLLVAGSIVMVKRILTPERILPACTIRLVAGTAVLVPFVLLRRERKAFAALFRPSPIWKVALPGAVFGGALAMGSWVAGMTMMEVAGSAVLNQLSTVFIFLLAAVVLGEPVTPRRIAALCLAFGGALLVIVGGG